MSNKRWQSTIFELRLFHNWIKSILLNDTSNFIKKNHNIHNLSLLDLAVGRGGDMNKWYYKSNIYNVVGIDIDYDSINSKNGANDRFNQMKKKLLQKQKKIPHYEFYVCDLSKKMNIPKIDQIIHKHKFDMVSCQFAIHYFFEKPEALDTFINIVSRNIKDRGFFIGTTMNGNKIMNLLKNNDHVENNTFFIKINNKFNKTPYGNTYTVSLGKKGEEHYFSKKPSVEYLVDIKELERVCEKYGLLFVGTTNFEDWYNKYKKDNNDKMSSNEKLFSFLNFSFIFQKRKVKINS